MKKLSITILISILMSINCVGGPYVTSDGGEVLPSQGGCGGMDADEYEIYIKAKKKKPDMRIIVDIKNPDAKIANDVLVVKPDVKQADAKVVIPDIAPVIPDLKPLDTKIIIPDMKPIVPDLRPIIPDLKIIKPDQYIPPVVTGDWFVRPNGGTRAQCTGKVDADYPGTGNNQPCAFKHPYYLFTDNISSTATWLIKGGDTVIIRGGPYKIGYKGPNAGDGWAFCAGNPYGCFNPTIPAGTFAKPTRILGENYANCNVKTKLLGSYANRIVLNLQDAKWVDVQCLEITDSAQCGRMGNSNYCSSNFPLDDYATNGVVFNVGSENIVLKNIDIHGLAATGVAGPMGGDITFESSRIAFNPSAGWDLDTGVVPTGGTVNLIKTIIEWNGCIEQFPIINNIPAFRCFDDNSGGYGDGIGTRDALFPNWNIEQSIIRYNTSDGLDLLHQSGSISINVDRSAFYGNMGQQYKSGAVLNTNVKNSVFIHNCRRLSAPFAEAPTGYNTSLSSFCRAAGDGLAISFSPNGIFKFENNTFVGYGATTMDIGCSIAECNGMNGILQNNIFYGYSNPNYNGGQAPGMFYYQGGTRASQWLTRANNIYYGMRNVSCPTGFPGEMCVDPVLFNTPVIVNEQILDELNLHLKITSPAINNGVNTYISNDYDGNTRPQGNAYDIGAFEYNSTRNISVTEFNKLFQNKSFLKKPKMKNKMSVNMCVMK